MVRVDLDTPVQYVKGVGPKLAKKFNKLGVETILDLLFFLPRDYEDRTQILPIGKLSPNPLAVVKGEIIAVEPQMNKGRFSVMKVILSDRTGEISAVWFNQPYLQKLFRRGMKLIVTGKIELSAFHGTLQLIVREFEIDTGEAQKFVPRYPLTQGLYWKKVRTIIQGALDSYLDLVKDVLPKVIIKKHDLIPLKDAIHKMHLPDNLSDVEPARRRLAFEDFFVFQLGMGLNRQKVKVEQGIVFQLDQEKIASFLATLPFKLTAAQDKVWGEISADMQSDRPMSRLLQGDVGSGKTIVATIAALAAIQNGYQVAIMAPTEILASQHFEKVAQFLKGQKIKIKLLTGTTQRKKKTEDVGSYDLVIGTHALIEEKIKFNKLGFVIIDEQHRFGVLQRNKLRSKGVNPDVLFMTATPIPRSLAFTLYGDLDRSVIDEMPPGRTPVKTSYVPAKKRKSSYEFMRKEINEGRQIFIVCPLVEESEKLDLKAAMDEAATLQKKVFPELKVGLLHGRLKGDEKAEIMKQFKAKKIHVLVSTTVIEVGIDIPNATVMVVEHAERFGLSQLHQLRGRIGRGADQSYCFLFGTPKTDDAKERIKAMVSSTDGFYIAEVDLKLRGPGDFWGVRQAGLPEFRVGDIVRDEELLREARKAAFALLENDPELIEAKHQALKAAIMYKYKKFLGY